MIMSMASDLILEHNLAKVPIGLHVRKRVHDLFKG